MRRLFLLALGLAALTGWAGPVHAAGNGSHQHEVNWAQRDTAIYVVSTLNLVRTSRGQPFGPTVMSTMDVTHFDVYADLDRVNIYFIELKRDDGSTAGILIYKMGWLKPRSISGFNAQMGLQQAPWSLAQAYRIDTKQLMASFTSSLPTAV